MQLTEFLSALIDSKRSILHLLEQGRSTCHLNCQSLRDEVVECGLVRCFLRLQGALTFVECTVCRCEATLRQKLRWRQSGIRTGFGATGIPDLRSVPLSCIQIDDQRIYLVQVGESNLVHAWHVVGFVVHGHVSDAMLDLSYGAVEIVLGESVHQSVPNLPQLRHGLLIDLREGFLGCLLIGRRRRAFACHDAQGMCILR